MTQATDAKIKTKFAKYNESLGLNAFNDTGVYAVREKMREYIPEMEDNDLDKFVIVKSKLLYVGTDEKEIEVAETLGIGCGGEGSDSKATIKEIQEIVDGVIELKDEFPDGQESTNDNTETGFIGTKLLDRQNHLFDETWNILIDYNNSNKEIGRYDKGYWLEKGKTYIINNTSLEFKNDYVIDYENKDFTILSENRVNWNVNATLGVTGNIPLNLDPMALANGEWKDSGVQDEISGENFFDFYNNGKYTGIQKTGDVKYDDINKALKFNESEDINPKGEKGYVVLLKNNVDFSNGFTFEFYGNFSRLKFSHYENQLGAFGIFSRCPMDFSSYENQMRFGWASNNCLLDLHTPNTGICEDFEDNNLFGLSVGGYGARSLGFDINEDAYMTVVYVVYDKELSKKYHEDNSKEFEKGNGNFDEVMDKQYEKYEKGESDDYYDKVLYYVNGKNFGYTHCSHNDYVDGGEKGWNTDEYVFHVGVSAWHNSENICYMQGLCYSTRLYVSSLTPEQVKLNYDMTLKYRDSFKDEKF